MGIKMSEQSKIVAAGNAVLALQEKALKAGMHVDQVNVRFTGEDGTGPLVVFEWDAGAGEYSMRTA